jgi:hypothetical protein
MNAVHCSKQLHPNNRTEVCFFDSGADELGKQTSFPLRVGLCLYRKGEILV